MIKLNHMTTWCWILFAVASIGILGSLSSQGSSVSGLPYTQTAPSQKSVATLVATDSDMTKPVLSLDRFKNASPVEQNASPANLLKTLVAIRSLDQFAAPEISTPTEAPKEHQVADDLLALTERKIQVIEQVLRDSGLDNLFKTKTGLALTKSVTAMGGPHLDSMPDTNGLSSEGSASDRLNISVPKLARLEKQLNQLPFAMPIRFARHTSSFGYRSDPFRRRAAFHAGDDFAAPIGTPIIAPAEGRVVYSGRQSGYGQVVVVTHGSEIETLYGHLSKSFVKPGDIIRPGQTLAQVGNTGRSTGPHLHYEIRIKGNATDPNPFLAAGKKLRFLFDKAL